MDNRSGYLVSKWIALGAALLLAGCASSRVDWESRLGGYSYDEAVIELGPPDKEATLKDGSRVAEWLTYRSGGSTAFGYAGGYGYPYRRYPYYGPGIYGMHATPVYEYWIRLNFDPSGTLTAWRRYSR